MRVLFLALMIALLPLRGWVGDAMAMDMAAAALEPAGMASDCPGHADRQAGTERGTDHAESHAGTDCSHCTACQICHSVALTPMALPLAAAALPAVAPTSSTRQPASAERTPGFKPPIS
jgi:hypothetical protein